MIKIWDSREPRWSIGSVFSISSAPVGLGHVGLDPDFVRLADRTSPASLEGMLDAERPHCIEHRTERDARPLADGGPAFLARMSGDLRSRRELLQLGERECPRCGQAALDRVPLDLLGAPRQAGLGTASMSASMSASIIGTIVSTAGFLLWTVCRT